MTRSLRSPRAYHRELTPCLLTSLLEIDTIIEQHRAARTSVLQIVDDPPADGLARLRSALPGIRLVQVIHVTGEEAIEQAEHAAAWDADAVNSAAPAVG